MDALEILSFLEKDSIHNNASNYYDESENTKTVYEIANYYDESGNTKTVYEIAVELEEKYSVVTLFLQKYKDDISFFIAKEKSHALLHPEESDNSNIVIANHIKGLWLDFMEKGEHGIVTIRARKTGTVGLIDTGEYYQSMEINYNGESSNEGLNYFS